MQMLYRIGLVIFPDASKQGKSHTVSGGMDNYSLYKYYLLSITPLDYPHATIYYCTICTPTDPHPVLVQLRYLGALSRIECIKSMAYKMK